MSSPSNPTSSSDQGDPWEQLAEDLFGLEYGKEHGSRESSSPAVEPVAPAPKPPAPPYVRAEVRPEPATVASPVDAGPQHSHDESSLAAKPAFAEAESSRPPDSPGEESQASPPPAAGTGSPQDSYWDALANWNWDESDGAGSKSKSEAPRSSGGPPPRGGPRGRDARGRDESRDRRGGEKPQRQASESSSQTASSPVSSSPGASSPGASGQSAPAAHHSSTVQPSAPLGPRPAAGDDFGLGVGDEPADFGPPQESRTADDRGVSEPRRPVHDTASRTESSKPAPAADRTEHRPGSGERGADQGPPKQEEGEFPRKKRRRRRRRTRGGDREPGSTTGTTTGATTSPASPTSDDDWDDSAGPESDAAAEEPQTPIADSPEETKDEFEGERHVPARGPRRGPRNDRTRRDGPPRRPHAAPADVGRSEEGSGEFEEEPLLVGGGVEQPAGEDDGEDDATEQAVSYEDVPSWEEAISYLLHPNQVQVEPGAGNGSAPSRQAPQADQPRQTRHMGGQKPRR